MLVRTGEMNPPVVPELSMSVTCTLPLPYEVKGDVFWSNLPPGESITMVVDNSFATATGGPFTNPQGAQSITLSDYPPATVTATSTTGLQVSASC